MIIENTIDQNLVLEKVYRVGGYDFRNYKESTISRRLERRLNITGAKTCQEYLRLLDTCPEEYEEFAEYLTIKVSDFFRSPYTFQKISELVLPELISRKKSAGERSLKLWSTACARGEEPYSIAILLADFLKTHQHNFDVQIYATDISRWALTQAQSGIYSLEEIKNVPSAYQENFTRFNGNFKIADNIRQMVRFSFFDLASNTCAPFTNIDCIFCCNVLIYWRRCLQERVLDMLYHALAPQGYLVLGEVETLPESLRWKLECVDSKAKIYKKNANNRACG